MKRSSTLSMLVAASAFWVLPQATAQQSPVNYPSKPVRILVGFAPGASTDMVARVVAQKLSARWGMQVIVDNRPGANTIIASDLAAKAPPDGYTLLLGNSSNATNPAVYAKLPYDGVNGLSSIVMVAISTNLISANPSFPATNLKQLIAIAKRQPGEIAYGTAGGGSSQHLVMELLALRANIKIVPIHYKGGAPALIDTVSGQIPLMIGSMTLQAPHVRAGKLKALMVSSAKRSPAMPDVATIAEQGFPGLVSDYWLGLMGPAGLPPSVVDKINKDVNSFLEARDVRETFTQSGIASGGGSAQEMEKHFRDELEMWATVVRDAQLQRMQM